MSMLLSVIVLTYNRKRVLERCLDRLARTLRESDGDAASSSEIDAASSSEIIVVDNASTDGTGAWLDQAAALPGTPPLVVVHRPANEFVCARNHAIDIARGQFIAQVDDDVLVAPNWHRILLEPLLRDPAIGAAGEEGFYQNVRWLDAEGDETLMARQRRPEPGQRCDFISGYCWVWRNDRTPAGARYRYDERFNPFWLEESDLQMQIRQAGFSLLRTWPVCVHDSLHDWDATHANRGPTAWRYAGEHLATLRSKWHNVAGLTYALESSGTASGMG